MTEHARRPPPTSMAEHEPKIELRRYLAGVPHSHQHLMSEEKTRLLHDDMWKCFRWLVEIALFQVMFYSPGLSGVSHSF